MKAWRCYTLKDIRLDEIPKPTLQAGDVCSPTLLVDLLSVAESTETLSVF
jgi:hypothetical protein